MRLRTTVGAVLIFAVCAGVATSSRPDAQAARHIVVVQASHTSVSPASQLISIHMIDGTQGWGLTRNAVLRTSDGGTTWSVVTPSGYAVQGMSAADFLDARTAWVSATGGGGAPGSAGVVLHTADGGTTWSAGALTPAAGQQFAGIGGISFIDAQHGWLMASLGAGAGSEGVEIFRSTDGGAHWASVSLTAGVSSTPGSLPLGGLKSGLAFLDATTGWATGTVYGPPGFTWLYVTHDGGRTWSHQVLTLPVAYRQGMPAANPPRFDTALSGILPVILFGPSSRPAADFYATRDGGRTWSSTTPLPYVPGNYGFTWDFVGAEHGWAVWGRQLHYTTDGGRHWATITPNLSLANVSELDFVGAHTGWALNAASGSAGGASLLKTVDAGRTWRALTPSAS